MQVTKFTLKWQSFGAKTKLACVITLTLLAVATVSIGDTTISLEQNLIEGFIATRVPLQFNIPMDPVFTRLHLTYALLFALMLVELWFLALAKRDEARNARH